MSLTSGGEAIVNGLVAHGVDTVFGLPGAQIYGLFDAFHQAQTEGDRRAGTSRPAATWPMVTRAIDRQARRVQRRARPGVLNAGAALLNRIRLERAGAIA